MQKEFRVLSVELYVSDAASVQDGMAEHVTPYEK